MAQAHTFNDVLCCTCCTLLYFPFWSDSNHISSNSKPSCWTVRIWKKIIYHSSAL